MKKFDISAKNIIEGLVIAACLIMAEFAKSLFKEQLAGLVVAFAVIVVVIVYIAYKSQNGKK